MYDRSTSSNKISVQISTPGLDYSVTYSNFCLEISQQTQTIDSFPTPHHFCYLEIQEILLLILVTVSDNNSSKKK